MTSTSTKAFDELSLFDVSGFIVEVPESESPSQSLRTVRQQERIQLGVHPLQPVARRSLKLHPEAAPGDDPQAAGRRCGNCRHLVGAGWDASAGQYPKCWFGWKEGSGQPPPRYTRSAASDCQDWWPACVDHEWRDTC